MQLGAGNLKARPAALPGAEKVAFAAQAQVFLGDPKAGSVSRKMASRGFAVSPSAPCKAAGMLRRRGPADPAARLVELRKPKALGVLDHHDGCFGHVDADSMTVGRDDSSRVSSGRRNSGPSPASISRPFMKAMHKHVFACTVLLSSSNRAWRGRQVDFFRFIDQRRTTQEARLPSASRRPLAPLTPPKRESEKWRGSISAGRRRAPGAALRDVHVAEISEHERARGSASLVPSSTSTSRTEVTFLRQKQAVDLYSESGAVRSTIDMRDHDNQRLPENRAYVFRTRRSRSPSARRSKN